MVGEPKNDVRAQLREIRGDIAGLRQDIREIRIVQDRHTLHFDFLEDKGRNASGGDVDLSWYRDRVDSSGKTSGSKVCGADRTRREAGEGEVIRAGNQKEIRVDQAELDPQYDLVRLAAE